MNEAKYNSYSNERFNNYVEEADYIMNKLRKDCLFCQRFFYGKDPKKCNIARLRSKILGDIRSLYGVNVEEYIFNTVVYETLWCKGTWKPLESYDKISTFFAWLRKVARNAILKHLEDEYIITRTPERTVSNTRLALKSQSREVCENVLEDTMVDSPYYDLLRLVYVERLSQKDLEKRLNLKPDELQSQSKEAENALKDVLLRSVNGYEEKILRNKKNNIITVSSDFVAELANWCRDKSDASPFFDVLGTNLNDAAVKEKAVDFLYAFSAKLDWKEEDRYLWRKRFLDNVSPYKLAEEMNRSRGWIDTRYSRLNEKFRKAIREWWRLHT